MYLQTFLFLRMNCESAMVNQYFGHMIEKLQEEQTGQLVFYLKGADVVMSSIVQYNDWLEEECGNMAREGLRTLVVAKKVLTEEQYLDFEVRNYLQLTYWQYFYRELKIPAGIMCLTGSLHLIVGPLQRRKIVNLRSSNKSSSSH